MGRNGYCDERQRALARPDASLLCERLDDYAELYRSGMRIAGERFEAANDDIITCSYDDPDRALAYVVLGTTRSDDSGFLGFLACGPLEDILRDPSETLLNRIVTEARKSRRFRWMLRHPFRSAIAPRSWNATAPFRATEPDQGLSADTLPPND